MPPWSLLELDPSVATERDVKRAYAKRLKICRPDQDPEGFRELHDAYTSALAELQWRQEGGHDEPQRVSLQESTPTSSDPYSGPTETNDPEKVVETYTTLSPPTEVTRIEAAFDELDALLRGGGPGAAAHVRAIETLLYQHPEQVSLWGERMHDLISRQGNHPDLKLKPEALLFELEHGGYAANLAIIDRLDRQAATEGLLGLANLLVNEKNRIANRGTGLVASHLAAVLAFWSRGGSSKVADLAYECLIGGEREFRMQLIDRHAAMADFLQSAPLTLKSFWRQQLLANASRESWDGQEGQQALRWIERASLPPQTYQTLFDLIPKDLSGTLKRQAKTLPSASHRSGSTTPEWDTAPTQRYIPHLDRRQSSGSIPLRFIGIIIFVVVKAIFLASTCSSSNPPPRSLPPLKFDSQSQKSGQSPLIIPGGKLSERAAPSVEFKDLLTDPAGRALIMPDPSATPASPASR